MVALAPNTNETPTWDVLDAFPKLHSRAREAKTTPCTEVHMHKSRSRIEIWLTIYETCDRLESFTRDPIGFSGKVWNFYSYVGGRSLARMDPTGNVTITTIEDSLDHPETDCGFRGQNFGMVYKFEIENKCSGGSGWIVQEVTVKCAVDKCANSTSCPRKLPPNSVHFFEAWRVTGGGKTADGMPGHTDVSNFIANDKTCGMFRADGEVRFICDEDIPIGQSPDDWAKDLDFTKRDPGPNCPVISSGGLPTSHDTPKWWGKSKEASATRFFEITWTKCCMCNIQQNGGPKKGK